MKNCKIKQFFYFTYKGVEEEMEIWLLNDNQEIITTWKPLMKSISDEIAFHFEHVEQVDYDYEVSEILPNKFMKKWESSGII